MPTRLSEFELKRLCIEQSPGEMRAALLDRHDRPWFLFSRAQDVFADPAIVGAVHSARLRTFSEQQGGAFLELGTGEEAFLALNDRKGLTEGQALTVRIAAGARRGKLARCVRVENAATLKTGSDPFEVWLSRHAPHLKMSEAETDLQAIDAAFEEANSTSLTLPKGGQIHIEPTRALIAVDVDSAGRLSKGSAGARALALNTEAGLELVRQICLRGLGGALVLDCVGPIHRSAGDTLQARIKSAFKAASDRNVQVFKPTPIGLLQLSVAHGETPISDLRAIRGAVQTLIDAMRLATREAEADTGHLFELQLHSELFASYQDKRKIWDAILQARLGGRMAVSQSASGETKVVRR